LCYGGREIKIYSKWQDYYDGVQAYGQDKKVIYKRKKIVCREGTKTYRQVTNSPAVSQLIDSLLNNRHEFKNIFSRVQFILFFCGKSYLGFIYGLRDKQDKITNHYCYSMYDIESLFKLCNTKLPEPRWYTYPSSNTILRKKLPEIFELSKHFEHNLDTFNLHHMLGTPVFIYLKHNSRDYILLNPKLKTYEFYKTMDAYTTFQEISMFISGVLGGISPPMIEISNDTKIAKHGFNKWSFRKEPEK